MAAQGIRRARSFFALFSLLFRASSVFFLEHSALEFDALELFGFVVKKLQRGDFVIDFVKRI